MTNEPTQDNLAKVIPLFPNTEVPVENAPVDSPVTEEAAIPAFDVAPETPVVPPPFAETGFITYTLSNGDFYITGDLTDVRAITRPATTHDFRHGSHDVFQYLSNENLINQLIARNLGAQPTQA